MKKIIAVVLLAVLILAAFNILSAPRVKAQASQAKVLSYYWYEAPVDTVLGDFGDLVAVGEVQNVGSNVIGYVVVEGTAYNSTGGFLNSYEVKASGFNLLPEQKAPFYIDFPPEDSITGDDTYTSDVTTVCCQCITSATPIRLHIQVYGSTSTVSASDATGTFTVSGTVQNTGPRRLVMLWLLHRFIMLLGRLCL